MAFLSLWRKACYRLSSPFKIHWPWPGLNPLEYLTIKVRILYMQGVWLAGSWLAQRQAFVNMVINFGIYKIWEFLVCVTINLSKITLHKQVRYNSKTWCVCLISIQPFTEAKDSVSLQYWRTHRSACGTPILYVFCVKARCHSAYWGAPSWTGEAELKDTGHCEYKSLLLVLFRSWGSSDV
jgi:hypothetical protein